VVGAGIAGLATAHALAGGGRRIVLLEQFAIGHDRGSSHGASRIFRLSYPEEQYVRDTQESLELWRTLERDAGEPLLEVNGSLDCGGYAPTHAAAMRACGVDCEELDAAEVERRFGVRLPGGALFQADGGILRADRCAAAFLAGARERGVDVREHTRATALEELGEGIVVRTDTGDVRAGAVVVAAGAWAKPLLATAAIDLAVEVTRETVVYLRLPRSEPPPSLIHEVAPGRLPYALEAPGVGLKAGVHQSGPTVDPDGESEPEPDLAAQAAAWAAERYVGAEPEPVAVETCLYTNAPEDRFVLERHDRIVVGSACSGHGFKFAPLTGARLAALAVQAAG
jgi:sarcosine oxidase